MYEACTTHTTVDLYYPVYWCARERVAGDGSHVSTRLQPAETEITGVCRLFDCYCTDRIPVRR